MPAKTRFARRLGAQALTILLVTFLGGFVAAALVRYSPGYGTDVSDLDPHISRATRDAMRAKRDAMGFGPHSSLIAFYLHYAGGALHGDFGSSETFRQPINTLLADRLPTTGSLVLEGSIIGWCMAFSLACLTVRFRPSGLQLTVSAITGVLLAVPPAVFGILFFYKQAPLTLAIGLILAPRLYGTLHILLFDISRSDLLVAARARGISRFNLARHYFATLASARLATLFGLATVIAFGCAVPIEALCDQPGLGQLALKSALSRDLPLLCAIALIVTVFITCVNAVGELLTPVPEHL